MSTNSPLTLISIVIPVFNEEQCLPELISRTLAVCQSLAYPYEIIMVDDGSRDGSGPLLSDAALNTNKAITAVFLNRNYGQHSALMAGFSQAQGDLIITLDADLQNPPEEIPRLVNKAAEGYDVVGTIRINRQDSVFRKTASRVINQLIQRSTGQGIGDYGCMLRAYRRHIVDAMLTCHERSTFVPLLANTFAQKVVDIPVNHAEREFGHSKYTTMRLINLMYDLVTCMTTTPLRLLSILGSVIALMGFLFSIFLIAMRIILGPQWSAEGVFILFALLFIFIGAQFIGMGLLGEYIGRIYHDVRARPRYFIQRIETTDKK
ncbi:undecaprenyl-phosphate 4-deoxy-4-formamido-L-arabinose transferase [Rosenbergiella sp. S61]|uniref:Undecaprenyl-phosphate 4-deoxy-4-formamido-L-arabinose transferase n=1 Tax=Rosenbergiella gaditana TaxID=2726987 RepID=A0ABS5SZJ1_9GAMM|nr:undecaprenyl-phosphate 4-deoxy-4-formamido-L-arabinose transferase [Rosenbergiella gaditana]MBT0725514.1 undecaprenyl-phosphate 4-deoxy-4-formamido-L-arabinose transferase [Rosenbergiella gaditana]